MTQEAFAYAYGIPLANIRQYEIRPTMLPPAVRAYQKVIDTEPAAAAAARAAGMVVSSGWQKSIAISYTLIPLRAYLRKYLHSQSVIIVISLYRTLTICRPVVTHVILPNFLPGIVSWVWFAIFIHRYIL